MADVEELRLAFAGRELEDHRVIGDYPIHNGNLTSVFVFVFACVRKLNYSIIMTVRRVHSGCAFEASRRQGRASED